MIQSSIQILYDTREQVVYIDKLKEQGYVCTQYPLETGDYQITDGITTVYIEVKNGTDFITSKFDGRLESQSKRLSQHPFNLIAVVGDIHKSLIELYDKFKRNPTAELSWLKPFMNALPNSLRNLQASALMRMFPNGYPVRLAYFPNGAELQKYMIYWARKMERGELFYDATYKEKLSHIPESEDVIKAKRIAFLTSIDGIGYKKAKAIAEHFDFSIPRILNAGYEEFTQIKGIGEKMYDNIQKQLISELHIDTPDKKTETDKNDIVFDELIGLI